MTEPASAHDTCLRGMACVRMSVGDLRTFVSFLCADAVPDMLNEHLAF